MIPYNILFKLGSKAVGTFMNRRKEKSDRAHAIAMQEMATGNAVSYTHLTLPTILRV